MIVDFIAGLLGGAAGVLVGHPFDTIKVHLQTDDPRNPKYKGTIHCLRTIILSDNVRGLYRGISSPMMGIGAVNAIVFGVYGNIQRLSDNPNSLVSHFWAGTMAGIAQSFICAPMELAKTRLQLSKHIDSGLKFKGPIDCLIYIHKTEGIRGTFKGLTATILRDIPGFSSYFVSYEFLMQVKEKPSIPYTLMAGGVAGMASWIACYPIDVIKTHMQADALGSNAKYKGFVHCAVKSYEREGLSFFFRGINSTLLRAFPTNAACFFVVSWVLNFCKLHGLYDIENTNKKCLTKVVDLESYSEKSDDELLVRKIISENDIERNLSHNENENRRDYYHRDQVYESQKLRGPSYDFKNTSKES